jgi:hypothetical protein
MRNWLKKHRVMGSVFGFLLAASLTAVAAWLVTSTNNDPATGGKAKSGSLAAPTWEAVVNGEIASTLYPGETGSLTFKINNPNTQPVKLTKLEPNGTFNKQTTPNGACASSFTVNLGGDGTLYNNAAGIPLPASASTVVQIPGAVTLDAATPTTCQSQTVSVYGLTGTFSS